MGTTFELFTAAVGEHRAGRLDEARLLYEQVLAIETSHAGAMHYLGVIAHQRGEHHSAIEWIRRSLDANSGNAAAHSNLGLALAALGRFQEAIKAYENALRLRPEFPDAVSNLGIALREVGRTEEALGCHERALRIAPRHADALYNCGNTLALLGCWDEAVQRYQQALIVAPQRAEIHNNLGNALLALRRIDEALYSYEAAIRLKPDYAEAYYNSGAALAQQDRMDEAAANLGAACQLRREKLLWQLRAELLWPPVFQSNTSRSISTESGLPIRWIAFGVWNCDCRGRKSLPAAVSRPLTRLQVTDKQPAEDQFGARDGRAASTRLDVRWRQSLRQRPDSHQSPSPPPNSQANSTRPMVTPRMLVVGRAAFGTVLARARKHAFAFWKRLFPKTETVVSLLLAPCDRCGRPHRFSATQLFCCPCSSSWVKSDNSSNKEVAKDIQSFQMAVAKESEAVLDNWYFDVSNAQAKVTGPLFSGLPPIDPEDDIRPVIPDLPAGSATPDNSPTVTYLVEFMLKPCETRFIELKFGQKTTLDRMMSNVLIRVRVSVGKDVSRESRIEQVVRQYPLQGQGPYVD